MNIVVTKNKVEYSNSFLKLSTLEEATKIVGTIDVLVFNNSNEDSSTKIRCLGDLKDRAKTLIYICNEKNTDTAIKMMIIGSDGKYFDDEFFLESTEELSNLVDSIDEVTELANLGGVNVLSDFFNRYLKNGSGSPDFNKNYLSVVKNAVNTLLTEYNEKSLEIIQMSETATEIFSNTSVLLTSMRKEKENMEEKVKNMANTLSESNNSIKSSPRPSITQFARIQYLKENKTIIRIKEVGNFKFLVSFMLGFRIYLENIKNVRPKLIIIEPVGDMYEKEYSEFPWVKLSNMRSRGNFYNNVVFTNCPRKDVINNLLEDDYDVFIVVDRTKSDKDHILNCKGSSVKYAISGTNSISKFRLPKKDCFTSILELDGILFTVPVFPEYPEDKSARERFYISEMDSMYKKLLVGIKGGKL